MHLEEKENKKINSHNSRTQKSLFIFLTLMQSYMNSNNLGIKQDT